MGHSLLKTAIEILKHPTGTIMPQYFMTVKISHKNDKNYA